MAGSTPTTQPGASTSGTKRSRTDARSISTQSPLLNSPCSLPNSTSKRTSTITASSPSTATGTSQNRAAMDSAATVNDLYARAQAMGLKLTREDIERTRAGVAAIVKRNKASPSSSATAPALAANSSPLCPSTAAMAGKKMSTPRSARQLGRLGMVPSSGSTSALDRPRLTLEQVSLRKEQDGEDRRRKRQRRKSEGTPRQPLSFPDRLLLGSSSSSSYNVLDFSSPHSQLDSGFGPQWRWMDRSGRPRVRPQAPAAPAAPPRMTLDQVGIRAEVGSEQKRRSRTRRRTAEDGIARPEYSDTDSIHPDDDDILPLLLSLPSTGELDQQQPLLSSTPLPLRSDPSIAVASSSSIQITTDRSSRRRIISPVFTPFRAEGDMESDMMIELPVLEEPCTPVGSPQWWHMRSSPIQASEPAPPMLVLHPRPAGMAGRVKAEDDAEATAALAGASATDRDEQAEAMEDVRPTLAAAAEIDDDGPSKREIDEDMTEVEPSSSRPRKRRKKARISDLPPSSSSFADPSFSHSASRENHDEEDLSLSFSNSSVAAVATQATAADEVMEAWDYADGTRVVKLVSEELAHALRSGTLSETEVEPRYFTLPAHWGSDKTKPAHASYAGLIGLAILSSSEGKLGLAEIYQWINTTFPYYEMRDRGWQNSIRHNLSLNKSFVKVERSSVEKGKGALWAIEAGHEARFENGTYNAKKTVVAQRQLAGAVTDNEADDEEGGGPDDSRDSNPTASSAKTKGTDIATLMRKHGGSQVLSHTLQNGTSHKYYKLKRDPGADVASGLAVAVSVPLERDVPAGNAAGEESATTGPTKTQSSVTPVLGGRLGLSNVDSVPASQESVRTEMSLASSAADTPASSSSKAGAGPTSSTPARVKAGGAASRRGGRTSTSGTAAASAKAGAAITQALSKAKTVAARAAAKVGGTASKEANGADGESEVPAEAEGVTTGKGRRRVPLKDKTNVGKGGPAAAASSAKGKGKAKAVGSSSEDADDGTAVGPWESGASVPMERGSSSSEAVNTSETSSNADIHSPEAMRVRSSNTFGGGGRAAAARARSRSSHGFIGGGPSPSHLLGMGMGAGAFALGSSASGGAPMIVPSAVVGSNSTSTSRWAMRSPISSLRTGSMGAPPSFRDRGGMGQLGHHLLMDDFNLLGSSPSGTAFSSIRSPEDVRSGHGGRRLGAGGTTGSASKTLASLLAMDPPPSARHQQSPLRGSPLRPVPSNGAGGSGSSAAAASLGGGARASSSSALKNGNGSVMLPIAGLTPARRILAGHASLGSSFSPLMHTPGGLGSGLGSGLDLGMGLGGLGMGGLRNLGIGANTGLGNVMSPIQPLSSALQTPARGLLSGSATGTASSNGDGPGVGHGHGRAGRRDSTNGGAGGGGLEPPPHSSWMFSSTPIRRLMSGAGSESGGERGAGASLYSPTSSTALDRNGSPYARSSQSRTGSGVGETGTGSINGGSGPTRGGEAHGELGRRCGGGGSSSVGIPSSSLGTQSTPSAAVAGPSASTGLTPAGEASWLGDPFGYQGNFSHELAFTTDMGGFGNGIDSSPAKDLWRS